MGDNIEAMNEELTNRHSEPEDYEAVHRVYSGPRAMADTLGLTFSSKEQWRERLAEEHEGEFSLVACAGSEVVGHLSVYLYSEPRRRHSGHFGMAVRDDWQGKGVGTKLLEAALDLADNWLGLTRLDLRVFVDNGAAIALYRKFGFEVEGTHEQFALRGGEYADAYVMARLKQPPTSEKLIAGEARKIRGAVPLLWDAGARGGRHR
jgi:L-phenylalanine/L-methionine N-acetyltransferase